MHPKQGGVPIPGVVLLQNHTDCGKGYDSHKVFDWPLVGPLRYRPTRRDFSFRRQMVNPFFPGGHRLCCTRVTYRGVVTHPSRFKEPYDASSAWTFGTWCITPAACQL